MIKMLDSYLIPKILNSWFSYNLIIIVNIQNGSEGTYGILLTIKLQYFRIISMSLSQCLLKLHYFKKNNFTVSQ